MAFFDELSKKAQSVAGTATEFAKSAAGAATEAAKKTADMVKINAAIVKEQHEMEKNYKALCEWFVSEYDGEIPEAVADVVAAIKASKEKVAQLQADRMQKNEAAAQEIPEGMKVCPVCGTISGSKFCPQCGAPLGE